MPTPARPKMYRFVATPTLTLDVWIYLPSPIVTSAARHLALSLKQTLLTRDWTTAFPPPWRHNGGPFAGVKGEFWYFPRRSPDSKPNFPSKRAITNLRAFAPPPTNYYKCPLKRRAAVLILLFADRGGDLRVVLTIRSAKLKNCRFLGHS